MNEAKNQTGHWSDQIGFKSRCCQVALTKIGFLKEDPMCTMAVQQFINGNMVGTSLSLGRSRLPGVLKVPSVLRVLPVAVGAVLAFGPRVVFLLWEIER